MDLQITFEPNLSKDDDEAIDSGLVQHIVVETGLSVEDLRSQQFAFVVRVHNKISAGLIGRIQHHTVLIDTLWIENSLRRQGIGRRLLNEAETFAKSKGCTVAFLNTLSPDNIRFYEEAGYVPEFERPKYLGAFTMHYFRKELGCSGMTLARHI